MTKRLRNTLTIIASAGRTSLVILMMLSAGSIMAQNERTIRALKAEADEYYDGEQFHMAIERYREIANINAGNADVAYRLAESYRRTFNYPEAEAYYLKTHYIAESQYPLALYYYALMLKLNGSFDESIQYFTTFIELHQDRDHKDFVEQAIIDRSGCQSAKDAFASGASTYPILALPFNSKFNDFAPAVRDSLNLVITSSRILSNRQSIDERFGEGFTDNYYYQKNGGVWSDKTRQLFSATNTKFNDGSGCFNSKGDKYYMTVCGVGGPSCKIYVSEWKNNRWNEPVMLNDNINFREFESRQPAISKGGDSLVFASNRPGGAGGFDLWLSINSGGENWGPAMNLGNNYNTKLNELSPSFTTFPNILFFASDGHEGFGGLDLYMAKRLSTGETILYNLGLPFNSNRDDAFLNVEEHTLYWSSNRSEGMGGFDVMAVKIPSINSFVSRMSLKNRNARRDIMLQKRVETTEVATLQASRIDERIDYDKLSSEKQRIVDILVEQYVGGKKPTATEHGLKPGEFDEMERIARTRYAQMLAGTSGFRKVPVSGGSGSIITATVSDSTTHEPLPDVRVILMDEYGQLLKITHANDEGRVRFTGLGDGVYMVRADRSVPAQRFANVSNITVSKPEVVANTSRLENIYFDFDHYKLRSEAKRALDQLADYLVRTPNAQLELFAFADDVGTTEYNLKLSQKRGESVATYLRSKGVDQTSIAVIAKGKQSVQEANAVLQRQYNRRVELNMNGSAGDFKDAGRTGILKKASDVRTLSQQLGVAPSVLRDLNGIGDDGLFKAYQPIRLPAETAAKTTELVIY